jgi:hypothetical protein
MIQNGAKAGIAESVNRTEKHSWKYAFPMESKRVQRIFPAVNKV